jgi:hypothetical protein
MRGLLFHIAGTMFSVALGALVARSTLDLWPLFALSILLGFVGWAVGTKEIRSRWRFLQTPAMRYAALHKSIREKRAELSRLVRKNQPIDRETWRGAFEKAEADVWAWVRSTDLAETQVRKDAPNLDRHLQVMNTKSEEGFGRDGVSLLEAYERLIEKAHADLR